MAMEINHNMSAQLILGEMRRNDTSLTKSLKKVSSGMRLNSAGDDASGYGISKRMEVMKRSLGQDIANSQTGRNLVRVAEGGIQEIINNLRQMKRMALNSANDTNTDLDRQTIEKEFSIRKDTIEDIATSTSYNGKLLLNGDYPEPHVVKNTLSKTYLQGGNISYPPGTTIDYITVTEIEQRFIVQENAIEGLTDNFSAMKWTEYLGMQKPYDRPEMESRAFRFDASDYSGASSDTVADLIARQKRGDALTTQEKEDIFSGSNMTVKIDFSGVTKDGAALDFPNDLDGQGFIIMCAACQQFINVTFDASKTTEQSEYYSKIPGTTTDPSYTPSDHQYVIGVNGVESADDLAKAVFEGIKNANNRPKTGDTETSLYVDARHDVRINKNAAGEYFFSKGSYEPNLLLYDKGIKLASEAVTTERTVPRVTYPTGYTETIDEIFTFEKDDFLAIPGKPLIIHTGTKANQNLRVFINDMKPKAMGIDTASVVPRENALKALSKIDDAITYALNENTRMGAYQSRLEQTEANLVTAEENTTASLSTIRDADMAKEMTEYTKSNLLLQASQSMLAQANQNSSQALSLLQ